MFSLLFVTKAPSLLCKKDRAVGAFVNSHCFLGSEHIKAPFAKPEKNVCFKSELFCLKAKIFAIFVAL
jgi:hypothetical protein